MSTEIERTQFCGQCVEKQAEIERLRASRTFWKEASRDRTAESSVEAGSS